MSELKPCPFCGGEAEKMTSSDGFTSIGCLNCNPLFGIMVQRSTEAEAIEAWNTRAERTCSIEERDELPYPVCSVCGAVQSDDYTVYYCWSCGAKVIT